MCLFYHTYNITDVIRIVNLRDIIYDNLPCKFFDLGNIRIIKSYDIEETCTQCGYKNYTNILVNINNDKKKAIKYLIKKQNLNIPTVSLDSEKIIMLRRY